MSDFSLEQTRVILNGHTVTGWSDDADALLAPTIEIASIKRGADGRMTASSTGDKGGPVTIKLLPNSPSVKFLQGLAVSQQNGSRITVNGIIEDLSNGIAVPLRRGVIMSYPAFTTQGKGETANMEYVIEFETINSNFGGASF